MTAPAPTHLGCAGGYGHGWFGINTVRRSIARSLLIGLVCACGCPERALAVEAPVGNAAAAVDPDSIPRRIGGTTTVGGVGNVPTIPYAMPKVPPDAAEKAAKRPRIGGGPDISGIYDHAARTWQSPAPSEGITPGTTNAPSALTLHGEERTDGLGSRGDYLSPLLRPWAAEMVKQLGDNEKAKNPNFERCLQNDGLLVVWSLGNRGLQILQTTERMYLFFGRDVVRIVHMNVRHPADLKPSVNGHSVGHWEGDTLVVDTIGFDGSSEADRFGTPSSEQMHVVERMNLVHGDQILEISFWVDDPVVYTQPWSGSPVTYWRADILGEERVCRESGIYPPPY
jgi:hypothetical protein